MDNFDFGSPALQAMSVPAVVVLVVLAALTLRSVIRGERAMTIGRPGDDESARSAYENRWRSGLPTS
jgi:hypothetical protein